MACGLDLKNNNTGYEKKMQDYKKK
jgi:hypothetical protein